MTPFDIGRSSADLFLGFSCFLLQQSIKSQVDKLHFCTREGVFFKAVFDVLFQPGFEGYRVDTNLLQVSRLSTFAPSMATNEGVDFEGFFRLYRQQSARTLIRSMGLNPNEFRDLVQQHGLEMDELFEPPYRNSRFGRLLEDERFLQPVCSHLARQRDAVSRYLEQHLSECSRPGIVDIGWRGTILNSIALLSPDKQFQGMYLGLAPERNIMSPNCSKVAYGPNQNQSAENVELLHAINVLEFVCLSNQGSAERYEIDDAGKAVAIMKSNSEENACIESFSLPFQEGVLSVARKADTEQLIREHESGELKTRAMGCWRDIVRRPKAPLVESYFALKSNEKFGLGQVNDQAYVPTLATVALSPFVRSRRQTLIRFLTYSQWAEGLRQRDDLGWVKKWTFFVLMKFALQYKRFGQRSTKQ